MGLAGLATDVLTLKQLLNFRTHLYELREHREMSPETFSALLSTMLYEKRFGPWFLEPIVAGLRKDGSAFLCGMDIIGAPVFAEDFVVSGTCTSNLHGMCEALYKKDLVRYFAPFAFRFFVVFSLHPRLFFAGPRGTFRMLVTGTA